MHNLDPHIRNAVRAVIIRDSRILLIRKEYEDGRQQFALPGGAQDSGETLSSALDRECREEIGTTVRIDSLLHVADWFKPRDTVPPSTRHLVEFLFACDVEDSYSPQNGHHPDSHQVEVVWVQLDALQSIPLHPSASAAFLHSAMKDKAAVYLGEIN
ncbi:MAG: NUDIX domain-containing protein [Gammaproteobacteria bacterium]|nr:NUDIX domain-containing protein [Gammaproteobacteria bacterium]MDX2487512.1 NUDIX domain-containing protein [Gammaproteobacteria bacterium]